MSKATAKAITKSGLIISVDGTRLITDPFKLTPTMLALVISRRDDEIARTQTVTLTKGTRTGASADYHLALEKLDGCHHDGYQYLTGLTPNTVPVSVADPGPHISTGQRAALFENYGFESGKLGIFTNERILTMAAMAAVASAETVDNPAWLYPDTLQAEIAAQLVIANDNISAAGVGSGEVATDAQNTGLTLLEKANSRVDHFYSQASDDVDMTAELSRINAQPRRARGTVPHKPEAPGTATLNAVAKVMSELVMPKHATYLHSWRQAAGGIAEHAGTSELDMPVVSLNQYSPLIVGTTYTGWVVGNNSLGDGPPSNVVPFTA